MSSLIEGTLGDGWEVMRGIVATDVFHAAPAVFRVHRVGEPVRVRTLLEKLFAELDYGTKLVTLPRAPALVLASLSEHLARLRPGQPEPRLTRYGIGVIGYSQTLDISRARRELQYRPEAGIEAGLARFARWWETHGNT